MGVPAAQAVHLLGAQCAPSHSSLQHSTLTPNHVHDKEGKGLARRSSWKAPGPPGCSPPEATSQSCGATGPAAPRGSSRAGQGRMQGTCTHGQHKQCPWGLRPSPGPALWLLRVTRQQAPSGPPSPGPRNIPVPVLRARQPLDPALGSPFSRAPSLPRPHLPDPPVLPRVMAPKGFWPVPF